MEIVDASITWTGPESDVLALYREPPVSWEADPVDFDLAILRGLNEAEQETGEIVGVEIVGFLTFDRWSDLPDLPRLWRLPSQSPLPLKELLQRQQAELRARAAMSAIGY